MNNDLDKNHCEGIEKEIQAAHEVIRKLEQEPQQINSPEAMEALERSLLEATGNLSALLLQKHLQASLDSPESQAKEREWMEACAGRLKNEGRVEVWVRTLSGLLILVRTNYYRRSCDRRKGKRYRGYYAGLLLLGIHERCTPLLASTVGMWCSLLASFEEVKQVLKDQGISLGVKVLQRIAYGYAERARILQQAGGFTLEEGESLAGRRIVVSCDGGRIRLREKKRGKKTLKKRTRYHGAWREPKLLVIYVVNAEGKQEKSFAPIIDGNLNGPEGIFQLIQNYLQAAGIEEADKVLFVADGAHWIWSRVPTLLKNLGLKPEQVHELLDFYHAVEHLGKIASLRKSWSVKERKAWIRKHRRLLLKGKCEAVILAIQAICRGRHGKAITTEKNYFIRNQYRMAYPDIKALNLPLGSGAVESAIRRVINLRLKGAGIFWKRENAGKILMLRSYYKAGRWNVLKKMANTHLSAVAA